MANADYVSTSGELLFAPRETLKNFTITINDDSIPEIGEYFLVDLSEPDLVDGDGFPMCKYPSSNSVLQHNSEFEISVKCLLQSSCARHKFVLVWLLLCMVVQFTRTQTTTSFHSSDLISWFPPPAIDSPRLATGTTARIEIQPNDDGFGVLQFASSTVDVSESYTGVVVTVQRLIGSLGTVSTMFAVFTLATYLETVSVLF